MKILLSVVVVLAGVTSPAFAQTDTTYGSGPLSPCVDEDTGGKIVTGDNSVLSEWGLEVAGGFSRDKAVKQFEEMQKNNEKLLGDQTPVVIASCDLSLGTDLSYSVRLPADNREDADKLCTKLKDANLPCIVRKN